MFHACTTRFDVSKNLEIFLVFKKYSHLSGAASLDSGPTHRRRRRRRTATAASPSHWRSWAKQWQCPTRDRSLCSPVRAGGPGRKVSCGTSSQGLRIQSTAWPGPARPGFPRHRPPDQTIHELRSSDSEEVSVQCRGGFVTHRKPRPSHAGRNPSLPSVKTAHRSLMADSLKFLRMVLHTSNKLSALEQWASRSIVGTHALHRFIKVINFFFRWTKTNKKKKNQSNQTRLESLNVNGSTISDHRLGHGSFRGTRRWTPRKSRSQGKSLFRVRHGL